MKKAYKTIFIQDWGTYGDETVVAVGTTIDEVVQYLKKHKASQGSIKSMEEDAKELSETMKCSKGFFAKPNDTTVGSFLWTRDWDNSWEHSEVLVHELFHAVYNTLGKGRSMMDEQESMAYQQEFLFRAIRRKLNRK